MWTSCVTATILLLRVGLAEPTQPDRVQAVHVACQPVSRPFSLTGGSPLASIDYNTSSFEGRVTSYTPPAAGDTAISTEASHPLFRISTDSPDASTTVTSLTTFNSAQGQILTLHLNEDKSILAASFSTDPLTLVSPSDPPESRLKVVLILPKIGPSPKLVTRKPVVLDEEGKEMPDVVEVEKTILQKYWWVFALVAVLALSGGGGDK